MKKSFVFLMAALSFSALTAPGAQPALARLWCLSLRLQPGQDEFGLSTLELSTLDAVSNGELAPTFSSVLSHGSGFLLYDMTGLEPVRGTIFVDVPVDLDANANGFEDFFEVEQNVPVSTTSGIFNSPGGNGTVQATWSRTAGAKDGTCVFRLTLNGGGPLGSFSHAFELIEYAGPLTYAPATNSVSGVVDLMQTGNSTNRLIGPVRFLKAVTNRYDNLELQPGVWTNAISQSLAFLADDFFRDPPWPTNYYGYFDFDDGDPATAEQDYMTWVLSIDDLNDSDADRIPDFSDDPGSPFVRLPTVTLNLTTTNLMFSISGGTVGRQHDIEQTTSITAPDWQTVSTVMLTTDPQIFTLPLPAGGTSFWRVRAF